MILNYIWVFLMLGAIAVATFRAILFSDVLVLQNVMEALFSAAKSGFEISLGLTGVLSLWLGIMEIGQRAGLISKFSKLLSPFFSKIFPEIPKNHPVFGSMFMNFSANMLGIDNAATPLGLKAMTSLQELNKDKETASNSQILFLVLNTSGLTLIPISVMVYRAQMGATSPSDVFLPILLTTYFSTLAGLLAVSVVQKINLLQRSILLTLGGLTALVLAVILIFAKMPAEEVQRLSSLISNSLILAIIALFLVFGLLKKINIYEAFIAGAKDGFKTAVGIIPYLIAILVAVAMFRASGALEWLIQAISFLFSKIGINSDFVGALPTALMKPLSGAGARGLMIEAMSTCGADSFVGRLACIFQGSTDTTFYILALYFGSVGVKRYRHALPCGLFADFVGIVAAIVIGYIFFH